MFKKLPLLLLVVPPGFLLAEPFDYRAYTQGHVDIGVRVQDGGVSGYWKNDGATVDGETFLFGLHDEFVPEFNAHEIRALGVFDAATPPLTRPAASQWDFLGVDAGEPIYILPEGGVPNTLPYLGFSTEHPSVAAFDEVKITLIAMTGPVHAVVSVFATSANVPFNTLGGFPAGTLEIDTQDHLHYNWAFTHIGTYDLTFRFDILAGSQIVHTGVDTFRFQITDGGGFDDYDHWRRTHFRPGDIEDDDISGPDVDAGVAIGTTKGFTNAQRYAFGNDPYVELTTVEHNGQPWPAIRLPMRVGMQDLETGPEQSDSLTNGAWENTSFILEQTDFIFHDPGLEIRTYRIEEIPSGSSFFRAGAWVPESAD